jgi:hypothetical protein
MRAVACALAILLSPAIAASNQEKPKIPKDSVELVVTGCYKDKFFRANDVSTEAKIEPPRQRVFRLSGKKTLIEAVKQREGRQVSVTGFVRKMDLQEPGLRLGGGRVVIGAPSSDPMRPPVAETRDRPILLEVVSFEELPGSCLVN